MGDLPDWVQSFANPGTQLFAGGILDNTTEQLDASNNASLTITAYGGTVNQRINLTVLFFTDTTLSDLIETKALSAIPDSADTSTLSFETPLYAAVVVIANLSGQTINLNVTGASRTVAQARILNDTNTGRVFGASGSFTNPSNHAFLGSDGGGNTYAANALSDVTCSSNTNGALFYSFVDIGGTLRNVAIGAVTPSTNLNTRIALPQGVIGFIYNALAINAAGTASLFVNPAQL